MAIWLIILLVLVAFVAVVAVYDVNQKKHSVLRVFPVVGHFRYWLESIGPELRQYIVTNDIEERPFTRDQRRWVYASAKNQNPYFGFGTSARLDSTQHMFIRHSAFPYPPSEHDDSAHLPPAKILGEWRGRYKAFRPNSIVNVSAMSFGSLSGQAIEALNKGSKMAGNLHNTGEGGISKHHRHGGELIYQLGTGYFGARGADGEFSMDALLESVNSAPVKAIEIKLSQGAKPGLGGVLPGVKVTEEVAAARGVPVGQTVASPNRHREFSDISSMLVFVERIAEATGLPVGIKSAVGDRRFWPELAVAMRESGQGPDYLAIDGGEGGTGAAPLVFSDHVALPLRAGLAQVFKAFASEGMHEKVAFIASGKLGFPGEAFLAMGLGADMIYVAREAMLSIGCVQAQKCHTGHCPVGVATQNKWLARGLDPTDKSVRLANYIVAMRHDLLRLANACGQAHPAAACGSNIDLLSDGLTTDPLWQRYGYESDWLNVSEEKRARLAELVRK